MSKRLCLKVTFPGIKNLINNQTFLIYEPEKEDLVTPCIDVYKAKIKFDGSIDKIELRILVREYFQNK